MRARAVRILLGVAVSVAFLYVVLHNISPAEIVSHLARTHWGWFAISAAFNLSMLWARGLRWRPLFYPEPQRSWPLVSATAIGFMANNVLPLRAARSSRGMRTARRENLRWALIVKANYHFAQICA